MTSVRCYTHCKAKKFSLTWTITNFSVADGYVQSATFTNKSGKLKWAMVLYSSAVRSQDDQYMSLYFSLVHGPPRGIRVNGRMAILNREGEESISKELGKAMSMKEGKAIGFSKFARRDDIMDKEAGILLDDALTVTCEIQVLCRSKNTQHPQVKMPEYSMADELGDLWDQSLFPDCSLFVAGQEFQAHKAILAARCPVFRAMFTHDMMERQTNRVEIHEMEPEVLKELLTFIYSGKAPNLQDVAAELLVAADMYLLERLKRMCEEALCSSLTVENAAEILIFTDLHLTPDLKDEAINFINSHTLNIMRTPGWKILQRDHPHLVGELNRSVFSAGQSPAKRLRLL
ncbi:speckle-type POZ protein-like [Denticeps clupeoides]|uniref:speckle-type POZ protein-like n=1 Tax=Denticeps clupeoides TaxID=299321 RepID=UPI0010A59C82|nr:speckle-type POZ protein-like [Denticeps clupeoides]